MDKQTQKNLLEIVKRNYEEIAEDFNETRKKYLWPELLQLTRDIKDGDKILDVGCGSGRLLEALKDKKINYLGVDTSEKLIKLAEERYKAAGFEFQVRDILELSKIPEINFDYVFCVAVLHHLPGEDLRLASLKQLKNKIKPEGKIIITVWNLWSREKLRKIIIRTELLKLFNKLKLIFRSFRRKSSRKSQIAECRALSISGDFGDIIFDWKNSKGEKTSRRYYHAFRKKELKKITKKAGLRIEKIYNDKFNYYAILKK